MNTKLYLRWEEIYNIQSELGQLVERARDVGAPQGAPMLFDGLEAVRTEAARQLGEEFARETLKKV